MSPTLPQTLNAGDLQPAQPGNLGIGTAQQGLTNAAEVYLKKLSPGSRPTMRAALRRIARIVLPEEDAPEPEDVPWHLLRAPHTDAIRNELADDASWSPATKRKALTALRRVMKECWRLGYITSEEMEKARDVDAIKGGDTTDAAAGRALERWELAALMEAALYPARFDPVSYGRPPEVPPESWDDGPTEKGRRDAALVALAFGCGMRRAELAELRIDQLDLAKGEVKFDGKGQKTRTVGIPPGTVRAVSDYLDIRLHALGRPDSFRTRSALVRRRQRAKRAESPHLFVRCYRGGRLGRGEQPALSVQGIYTAFKRLYTIVKAKHDDFRPFSPHDFRRTYVGDLLDLGVDVVTVQKLAGHADPTTTSGYDRRAHQRKIDASRRLDVPYGG